MEMIKIPFESNPPQKYKIKTADQLDNTPVEWLIPSWIPKRGIKLLFGDGGTGKSYVWGSIVSALSKGNRNLLSQVSSNTEKRILTLSGEDAECVLRSRFEKLNAKMENVFVIGQDSLIVEDEEQPEITFSNGILAEIVEQIKPDLLILDPLQSFIGPTVDMSRRNQMRTAMKPLQVLSAEYDMPVLVVAHSNKRENAENGRDKLADSADLWDIARSVIMVGYSEGDTRFISLEKSSYADHLHTPTKLFSIDDGTVTVRGECSNKLRDFVRDRKSNKMEKTESQKELCQDAMLELLENGEMDSQEFNTRLKNMGFSKRTVDSSRKQLINEGLIRMNKQKSGRLTYITGED